MGFLSLAGYVLLGMGPPAAVFVQLVAKSPFVVLVSMASSFFWVTVLLLNAMLWKPLRSLMGDGGTSPSASASMASLVLPLLTFLVSEELCRPVVLRRSGRLLAALDKRAAALRHPAVTASEKVHIHLGIGAGQGFAHAILFFLSTVFASNGDGTYYASKCPHAPYFLIQALNAAAFFITLTFAMVIAFLVDPRAGAEDMDAGSGSKWWHRVAPRGGSVWWATPPAIHALCVGATLLSLVQGGCIASVAINLAIAAATAAYAGAMAIKHVRQAQSD